MALLWAGLSLSAVGDQLYALVLAWIATGVLGAAAGYLSALQAATVLTVAVLGGGWADGRHPLRLMLALDLARAAVLAALVLLWSATGAPSAAGLALTVVALAAGLALFNPAVQLVLPTLVADRALLPAANGLFDGTERSARLLGPGLLAVLGGSVPLMHFLTIDAATFLLSAAAVWCILRGRSGAFPAASAPVGPAWRGGVASMARGVRAARRHELLGYALAVTGPMNGVWYAVFFLGLPLLLKQQAITGVGTYGLLISVYGATNLASNLICGSLELGRRPQVRMFASGMVLGVGMAAFAAFGWLLADWRLTAFVAASALAGVAGPMKDIPVAVLRQSRLAQADVPAAARAQMAAANLGTLVCLLAAPGLIGALGVAPVVFGCGAVSFLVGLIGLVRYRDWVEP